MLVDALQTDNQKRERHMTLNFAWWVSGAISASVVSVHATFSKSKFHRRLCSPTPMLEFLQTLQTRMLAAPEVDTTVVDVDLVFCLTIKRMVDLKKRMRPRWIPHCKQTCWAWVPLTVFHLPADCHHQLLVWLQQVARSCNHNNNRSDDDGWGCRCSSSVRSCSACWLANHLIRWRKPDWSFVSIASGDMLLARSSCFLFFGHEELHIF